MLTRSNSLLKQAFLVGLQWKNVAIADLYLRKATTHITDEGVSAHLPSQPHKSILTAESADGPVPCVKDVVQWSNLHIALIDYHDQAGPNGFLGLTVCLEPSYVDPAM